MRVRWHPAVPLLGCLLLIGCSGTPASRAALQTLPTNIPLVRLTFFHDANLNGVLTIPAGQVAQLRYAAFDSILPPGNATPPHSTRTDGRFPRTISSTATGFLQVRWRTFPIWRSTSGRLPVLRLLLPRQAESWNLCLIGDTVERYDVVGHIAEGERAPAPPYYGPE